MKWRCLFWSESPRLPSGNGILTRYLYPIFNKIFDCRLLNIRSIGQEAECRYKIGGKWFNYYEYTCVSYNDFEDEMIYFWIEKWKPDILFTIGDLHLWSSFKKKQFLGDWLSYLAVDSYPLEAYRESLERIDSIIVFTNFGYKVLKDIGIDAKAIIPHGIDLNLFYPLSTKQRNALRSRFGLKDKCIVGGIGQNQQRKRWDIWLMVLKNLTKLIPNVIGLLHVPIQGYYPLPFLIKHLDLEDKVILSTDLKMLRKIPYERMFKPYNLMHIYLHTAACGGFEYPLLEASACKTPCIATLFSGQGEIIYQCGLAVKPKMLEMTGAGTFWSVPDIDALTDASFQLLTNNDKFNEIMMRGYQFSQQLSWDTVEKQWLTVLERLYPSLPKEWMAQLLELRK